MTTTRYYQINGEFHTYDWLHDNLGYTKTATTSVTYKTTDPWGGTASSSGYSDHPSGVYDFDQFSFFVSGVVGWHSPNALALEGYYPSDSTEFLVIKDGVVSNAARYDDAETGIQDEFYYLVEADLNTGWMTQSEFDQSGWVEYIPDESPKGYIVVDSSGAIQHSIDLDDMYLHQIQHSVEVVNFYFTSNGAAETENSELSSGVDVTLYNADGTVADDDLYDGAGTLTYTQANGNMFEAADGGDLISLQSGALVMNPNADYTALSVQVEEQHDSTTLDMILGLRWDPDNNQWKTVAFDQPLNDNFWWSCLLSENDKAKVINFGLSTTRDTIWYVQGDIGVIVWDKKYSFEVLDIYSDLGQTSVPGYDLSHLTAKAQDASQNKYTLTIWSDVQDNTTQVMAWKCRIAKKPYIDVDFAFAFDSATGTTPEAVQPTRSDWWYSGILTQDDEDRINAFGLQTNLYSNRQGTIGSVIYDNNYLFEMIGMFADMVDSHGAGSIAYDPSKFYCSGRGIGTRTYLVINNTDAFPTAAKVWRCRITKLNP